MFKRRRFPVEIILLCVRWYCKYGISYRDLVEMMQEGGVEVDPSTIMRWVHRYAPELEKRVRWYQRYRATSWRVHETYVKVGSGWKYLFRDVDTSWFVRYRSTNNPDSGASFPQAVVLNGVTAIPRNDIGLVVS